MLEARLNATSSGIAPFTTDMSSKDHWYQALGWFHEIGFDSYQAKAFVQTVSAPLSDDIRDALAALIDMRWRGAEQEVDSKDWAEFQRLTDPSSSDFILDNPDYFAFFTYSLFWGIVGK